MTWCKMLARTPSPCAGSFLTLDILSLLMTSQGWGLPTEAPSSSGSWFPARPSPGGHFISCPAGICRLCLQLLAALDDL